MSLITVIGIADLTYNDMALIDIETKMISLDNLYTQTRNKNKRAFILYEEIKLRDLWTEKYNARKGVLEAPFLRIFIDDLTMPANAITNLFNSLECIRDWNNRIEYGK